MELLRAIESVRSHVLDAVNSIITTLGEETIAIAVLCVIFWCVNKKVAYFIGVAYFFSGLTVQGMKICFRIDRPWVIDPDFNPVPTAVENATGYSFPSGHTQSATALFGSLGAMSKSKPVKAAMFTITALVAISRMYLGVHTPQDVVVSLIITYSIIFITSKLFQREKTDDKGTGSRLVILIIMALFSVVVIIIAATLYSKQIIDYNYLSDCLKAAGAGVGFAAGMYIEREYIKFPVESKNYIHQIVKYGCGIAGVLLIKEGMKMIIGTGLVVDPLRYFLMLIWVTVLFPLLIRQFFKRNLHGGEA